MNVPVFQSVKGLSKQCANVLMNQFVIMVICMSECVLLGYNINYAIKLLILILN